MRKQPVKDKGGRPPHEPTDKDRQIVETLAGVGFGEVKIATVLGITQPTLDKYYTPELERGRAKVEANLVGNLMRLTRGNDSTALKAIMFALQCRFGWSVFAPDQGEREVYVGKKETLRREAETGGRGTAWDGLLQ